MRIDLHSHSSASDGTDSPADVVRRAADAGVDVLALTDHDTASGWAEAEHALPAGLTLVRGIELSCRHAAVTGGSGEGAESVHMLGYLFDPGDPVLAAECDRIRSDRVDRARATVARLRELGAEVTWEQVLRIAGDGVVGRPHIARAMVEAGVVRTADEAFTADWIGTGGRAHVDRYALDPVRAVSLVADAGGVCVLAHARARRRGYVVDDDLIEELAAAGLAGLEVDHPDHDAADRAHLRDLAGALGLFATGSSDDHGKPTGHRLGCETTSPEAFEALVASARGK
ncbi:PHP domain-containing protein [Actinomadura sp. HBU206391]|uniref:PHP domain-containing protein n=1 Tax=Actinomadura sp. HBU206391 TaxID=2731692 RepID=UPI00164FC4E0|nr:PHP domain-containing protein [Actinomadura sp. HBU206391]MBC6463365.1 PHP domain-containing protein [Actinomadura sp. HBU206391]